MVNPSSKLSRVLLIQHAPYIWLFVGLFLCGCADKQPHPPEGGNVRARLEALYPYRAVLRESEFQYDPSVPLQAVELPALAEALPEVRFFVTRLRTGAHEYPEVEVAVAAMAGGPLAVYRSPTFGNTDYEFIDLLQRAKACVESERRAVAEEIARLFAIITYKGDIRTQHFDGNVFNAELWHGQLLWRRITIVFDEGGVASVKLKNPRTGGLD